MTEYIVPIVYPIDRNFVVEADSLQQAKQRASEYAYYANYWQANGALDWDHTVISNDSDTLILDAIEETVIDFLDDPTCKVQLEKILKWLDQQRGKEDVD